MLQKELAKRLKSRYDTKMDGDGWLAVSSDGMPLCRVKYNGNCIVNDNPYLSEEYLGKIAEVQNELLTVKDYVALYEHAQQMKAADVSEYRQLAAFGDTVLAATYSEKNGFMFCTWKQNADGRAVFACCTLTTAHFVLYLIAGYKYFKKKNKPILKSFFGWCKANIALMIKGRWFYMFFCILHTIF